MDPFHFGNVKAEKATAMRSYNLLTTIAKTLRILELCLALLLFSWILTRLPFALNISAHYVRRLSLFIGSPLFVFIISNAIIATLLAKSGRLTAQNSHADNNSHTELYQQFLKNSADRTMSPSETDSLLRVAEGEVVYQDKQIISEMNTTARTVEGQAETDPCTDTGSDSEPDSDFPKVYRRSRSEKLKEESRNMMPGKLRRSETEKHMERASSGCDENLEEILYPQDKLSNEEFQRTIEAFIAKQTRFLREESLAVVIQKES